MKQSRLIAFSLTLFMLLLVVVAGFLFTVQSQRTLQTRLEGRDGELAASQDVGTRTAVSLAEAVATGDAANEQIATTEADLLIVDDQLNAQLKAVATSDAMLAEATATIAAADGRIADLQQELQSQQPEVSVEVLGTVQIVAEPIYFFVAASDAAELSLVSVTVGEETTDYAGEGQRLFTQTISRTLQQAGPYTITVTAVNSHQITVTTAVTGTLLTAAAARQAEIRTTVNDFAQQASRPPQPQILILGTDFTRWLTEQFAGADVTQQSRVLQAFGLILAEDDLTTAAWQKADFAALYYDPAADRFVALDQAALTGQFADWVYAQQALDLPELPPGELTFDSWLALNAQNAGEGLLWQGLYLARSEQAVMETAVLRATLLDTPDDALADMPAALRQQLLFPYTAGYQWALDHYQAGGLAAVAAARQPQSTTAQVLFGSTAVQEGVTLPDLQAVLGDSWQMQGQGVWGAFRLQQYLAAKVDGVETAVAGWAGDQYAVYWNETNDTLALVLLIAWDSPQSADAFNTAFADYPPALYGNDQPQDVSGGTCWQGDGDALCLFTRDAASLIVRAPTSALAEKIGAQIP